MRSAKAAPPWREYHDVTYATHTANYNTWIREGYRPVSVSIYGSIGAQRFAGVYVQQPGPTCVMIANIDAAGFQEFFNVCAAWNYRFTQISAMGSAADPRYVVVAESSTIGIPHTRYQLVNGDGSSDTHVQFWLNWARANNQIPRTLAISGSTSDPRYALALEPNPNGVIWNVDGLNETYDEFEDRYAAQLEQRGRLGLIQVSQNRRYLTLFRGDQLTTSAVTRAHLPVASLESEIEYWRGQGRYPIHISGGGSGDNRRFAALFVADETIRSRSMSKRGDNRSPLLDTVMENMITSSRVRQASLAVIENRRLIYARTFTRAESGYPVATPTTQFRIASGTKTLTAMLIMRMIQEGRLSLTDWVQPILNLRQPDGSLPVDGRFDYVTVEQLLRHQSGVPSGSSPQAVATANGDTIPVNKTQLGAYLATQPLDFQPGFPPNGVSSYSNNGYVLLGMLVQAVLGMPFYEALQNRLFTPLGATRMRRFRMLPESQGTDDAVYDSSILNVGPTVCTDDGRILPIVYGAEWDAKVYDASGGVSVAMPDLAKVIASLNVRAGNPVLDSTRIDLLLNRGFGFDGTTTGPRKAWKGGMITGTQSNIHFEEGGVSYVIAFNNDKATGNWYPDFADLRTAVTNTVFPAADLFPSFGIPSF